MPMPSRRRWTLLLTVMTSVLVSVPAAVWAAHQFDDVPDSHIFHTGISWMADNNITVGCNPPANDRFCPDDNVTRGQMATFMKRLAENNVVDAATLDGMDSGAFLTGDTFETSQGSTGWTSNSGLSPTAEAHFITRSRFTGAGIAEMALVSPISIGETEFGLTNIRVCVEASAASYLDELDVYRLTASVATQNVFSDATDRTATGCYDYPMSLAIGEGLAVAATLAGSGNVYLGTIHMTWEAGAAPDTVDLDSADGPHLGN